MIKRLMRSLAVVLATVALAAPAASAVEAQAHGHGKVVGGVEVYLGVIPAAMLSQYPPNTPEARMHGGVPSGNQFHHVMVSLFEASTGKRITDAEVTATVRRGTRRGVTKPLQPMSYAGYTSYGNYFAMPDNVLYRIDVAVRLPHTRRPIEARFRFEHVLH